MNLSAVNRWHGIVAKGSANSADSHNYALEVNSGNRVECAIGNGGSSNVVASSATLAAGTLYHLACVWTGTQLQVYVNGVLSGSGFQSLTPLGNLAPLSIGQFGGAPIGRTRSSTRCVSRTRRGRRRRSRAT